MRSIYILKFILSAIGFLTVISNIIESIYIYLFDKPIFVHLYFVKKKLSQQKKAFLVNNITFYNKLDESYKAYYEHRIARFLRTYDFIERDGFKLTSDAKVLLASSYVKLTFGMRRYLTNTFNKIIIYPEAYYSLITKQYHKGEYNPALKLILFSWEDFLLGDMITNDNINLGIHEFTHALTFHGSKSKDASARIFYRSFNSLTAFLNHNDYIEEIKASNYFRAYGFTNKVEFVAVIMEHFFESPNDLKKQFPELFTKVATMLNYNAILNKQLSSD